MLIRWSIILLILISTQGLYANSMSKKQFIARAFHLEKTAEQTGSQPEIKTLWLDDKLQKKISKILDHRYPKLRLRYWVSSDSNKQSVWFLDEVGKELPISFGISIIDHQVSQINVLKFRESRGGEIRMQSFSEQFKDVGLSKDTFLNKTIDGISGATMSVSAMKKITRLALLLHREISQ